VAMVIGEKFAKFGRFKDRERSDLGSALTTSNTN
jgi:hypothetical protein